MESVTNDNLSRFHGLFEFALVGMKTVSIEFQRHEYKSDDNNYRNYPSNYETQTNSIQPNSHANSQKRCTKPRPF
jgi:hypothetical protein